MRNLEMAVYLSSTETLQERGLSIRDRNPTY